MTRRRWRAARPSFLAVLFVLGFLVSTGYVQEQARERELPARRQEVQELVRQRRETISDLSREVADLVGRLGAIERRTASGSAEVRAALDRLEQLQILVGLEPLRGPGLVVELADSGRTPRTREEAADLRIQDVDLVAVVNALWRAGAEALAVNGRRVVATTAIRRAGSSILVNYGAVSSPYRVVALGDPSALARGIGASETARRFEVWRQVYGLGFSVHQEADVAVPPIRGLRPLRWARPEAA